MEPKGKWNPKVIHNDSYVALLELRNNPDCYEIHNETREILEVLSDYEKARLFDILLTSYNGVKEMAFAFEVFTVSQ